MIDPAGIPVIAGDMDALAGHGATLSGVGAAFADTGARIHTGWQSLGAVYRAPEAGLLLAATGPVAAVSASVGEDITAVGAALRVYAAEVAVIKTRLASLRTQAVTFVDTVAAIDDWRADAGTVEAHNQLVSGVNAAVAEFMDAQRRCANTILALYTDRRYTADNGDDTVAPSEFGYTTEQLDTAMTHDGALPWGSAAEHDRGFWGDVGAFFGGAGDSLAAMVAGLGALIGYADGGWSWGTAGTAWQGLGTLVVAIGAYTTPGGHLTDQTIGYPGFDKGQLGAVLTDAGKAIIAYDEWEHDPSRAAGMATTNILTTILGTKGVGAGVSATGAALQATRLATATRIGTALTRAGDTIGALPTLRDTLGAVTTRVPALHIPHIDLPHTDLPPSHIDTPHTPEPARPADTPAIGDDAARANDAADTGPSDGPATDSTPDTAQDGTAGPGASPDADHGTDAAPGPDPAPALPPGVHAPLERPAPLPTQELDPLFRGENDPTNPNRIFRPDTVTYMTPEVLEQHRIVVIDGRLHSAADGSLFDTSGAGTLHSGRGRAMFVMDENGNLYASLQQVRGELHHSSFLSGRPVAGAGEIVVRDGVPQIISRKSGHYQPSEAHQQAVSDMLADQGLDVSPIAFESGF